MLILAFDTTMAACSVAVWRDGATLAACHEPMERGQAEALMPLIAATMAAAKVTFPAVTRIAVTVGPGSFTGVRVGLAGARGFGLALNIPVIGATTGEVLARNAAPAGTVISLIDTKRGDLYVEAFEASGARLLEPTVIAAADIASLVRTEWPRPLTLVGDGSGLVRAQDLGATVGTGVFPDATALAEIAAARTPEATGPLPVYVRPPSVTMASR